MIYPQSRAKSRDESVSLFSLSEPSAYEPEAVAVRQLADKVGFVAAFGPSFSQIQTNGARRPSDLTRQREFLVSGEASTQFENAHRQLVGLFVNDEVLR